MSEAIPQTTEEVIAEMNEGLEKFLAFLDQLTEAQMMQPKDDVGWNVRDHLTHLAVWADGVAALARREDRWAAMSLAEEVAHSNDFDRMNSEIVGQHRHLSVTEARDWVIAAHERMVAAVAALEDEELQRPYDYFVPPFTGEKGQPILNLIFADSVDHYEVHIPWIKAIVADQ